MYVEQDHSGITTMHLSTAESFRAPSSPLRRWQVTTIQVFPMQPARGDCPAEPALFQFSSGTARDARCSPVYTLADTDVMPNGPVRRAVTEHLVRNIRDGIAGHLTPAAGFVLGQPGASKGHGR